MLSRAIFKRDKRCDNWPWVQFCWAALFGGTGLTLIADGSGGLLAFDVFGAWSFVALGRLE